MRTLQNWLIEYSMSHQNPANKQLHLFCVPLISVSLIGILWSASSMAALIFLILVMAFYFSLSRILFLFMSLFSAFSIVLIWALSDPLLILSPFAPIIFYIGLFIVGWAGQFYGHHLEGRKPSFFKDIQFLLIGPAWCVNALAKKAGIAL
jgi:uncharacterized membrane protein YGL010W